jgi:hypothetical protein
MPVVYGIEGLKTHCKLFLLVHQGSTRSAATCTSAPAIITPPPRASTSWACSCPPREPWAEPALPGPLGAGPVPGALPGLRVLQRRRAPRLHRLGGHDAPQSGPPGAGVVLVLLLIYWLCHEDGSLFTGKQDDDETLPETAHREVSEEIDLRPRLGVPLPTIRYDGKDVRY